MTELRNHDAGAPGSNATSENVFRRDSDQCGHRCKSDQCGLLKAAGEFLNWSISYEEYINILTRIQKRFTSVKRAKESYGITPQMMDRVEFCDRMFPPLISERPENLWRHMARLRTASQFSSRIFGFVCVAQMAGPPRCPCFRCFLEAEYTQLPTDRILLENTTGSLVTSLYCGRMFVTGSHLFFDFEAIHCAGRAVRLNKGLNGQLGLTVALWSKVF
ncbi:MAG: hypothetical protein J3Q66DRAFT_400141 [Benniella sp.]|nr:MAG: hypothetical protein J3Q66DRAFT_400141 [Benniella sp.]